MDMRCFVSGNESGSGSDPLFGYLFQDSANPFYEYLITSRLGNRAGRFPHYSCQSYRWLLRCSAVHAPRDISRFTFFSFT
eukprot:scaffold11344_cov107-Skeletonema_marinoi.AAC.1